MENRSKGFSQFQVGKVIFNVNKTWLTWKSCVLIALASLLNAIVVLGTLGFISTQLELEVAFWLATQRKKKNNE